MGSYKNPNLVFPEAEPVAEIPAVNNAPLFFPNLIQGVALTAAAQLIIKVPAADGQMYQGDHGLGGAVNKMLIAPNHADDGGEVVIGANAIVVLEDE